MKDKLQSGKLKKNADLSWQLYIVECSDGSLYTGITNNIERRLKMHNDGKASYYTSLRRPVKLRYSEGRSDRKDALVREYEVKTFSRDRKIELINSIKTKKRKRNE